MCWERHRCQARLRSYSVERADCHLQGEVDFLIAELDVVEEDVVVCAVAQEHPDLILGQDDGCGRGCYDWHQRTNVLSRLATTWAICALAFAVLTILIAWNGSMMTLNLVSSRARNVTPVACSIVMSSPATVAGRSSLMVAMFRLHSLI